MLLHSARIGNDDVPAFPYFERLKVKANLIGGFQHIANMLPDLSFRYASACPFLSRTMKQALLFSSSVQGDGNPRAAHWLRRRLNGRGLKSIVEDQPSISPNTG